MVDGDNDGLDSLHDVDPAGALLAPHHPVVGRQEHEPDEDGIKIESYYEKTNITLFLRD